MKKFDYDPLTLLMPPALEAMLTQGRLVHSLNIEGDRGTGRRELAIAVAGAILCRSGKGRMCGVCDQCQKVLLGAHSDITLLDGSSDTYRKDSIRRLRGEAYQKPSEGCAKVTIFLDAQLLSAEVQNLLLKVVEEPPENTYFIFTCDNRYRLLSTILSRVVTVHTLPVPRQKALAFLEERAGDKPQGQREHALELADGSPGLALEILTDPACAKRWDAAQKVVEALAKRNACGVMAAMAPLEKQRADYAKLMQAVGAMLMNRKYISVLRMPHHRAVRLREAVARLQEYCDSNGYPALLSALLAEYGKTI